MSRIFHRLGQPYLLQCVPIYGGQFMTGKQVYAYIRRNSDQAIFNFYAYTNDPSGTVWVGGTTGQPLPGDLTQLRGLLTEFSIGTDIHLAYSREWNFPENKDADDAIPKIYTVWYYSPGSLGIIGVEEVVFMPKTLSFNAYYASPVSEGQFTARQG